ncbi:MAG: Smr/MutS family protein, partial [Bacteroidales bacterium]|nr:Smr/MutS family protein [Bacteroidales bacterium]
MIYPENFEQKIGFDKIRNMLSELCISSLGKKYVEGIRFESSHGKVHSLLSQAEEFRQILLAGKPFPNSGYFDLTPELKRINLKGTYLDPETLFDLKSSLETINNCLDFFKSPDSTLYPELTALTQYLETEKDLLKIIEGIIDDKGMIKDTASPELRDIRMKLHRKQKSIDGRIKRSMTDARKAGFAPENAEVTIRNGRLVIPVQAANKRQVHGFIHDESATGQTVYIEPTEVFDLNNEIRELENSERREIIHILIRFTDLLRPKSEQLIAAYDFLGQIDFIRAKAKYALMIEGVKPHIKPVTIFNWQNARHPLLYLSLKEQKKAVVPMNLELNRKNRILVISGPNAGGKSVCLKTVGLLQYMLQCGCLVPMEEESEAGIFKEIFLDIGDEQSLENDLSTYSSHLLNIRHFIQHGNRNTLFLIDEFGTGTEPQLGGAIAEAALHALNKGKAFGVVTTHYANIKLMADQENGIINGAMLFDTNELKPLYILRSGNPGSSFAFEIARQTGFPDDVLDHAASISGYSQIDFEKQLQELETEKIHLAKEKETYGVADSFLSEMIDKYERLIDELNTKKAEILEQARQEAGEIIAGTNRLIEHTIKEIREAGAEKEKTRKLRKELAEETEKIIREKPKQKKKKTAVAPADNKALQYLPGPIEAGDQVEIIPYGKTAEVISLKAKYANVLTGSVTIKIPLKDLRKVKDSGTAAHKKSHKASRSVMSNIHERAARFKPSIDLRGKRAWEAMEEIQAYIDDAILLSVKEVSILHGKGDGILRQIIREYLQGIDEIEQFSDAHVERGGQGITNVRFR